MSENYPQRTDSAGAGRRVFFRRRKSCPLSGPHAPKIDYKDVKLLQKYCSTMSTKKSKQHAKAFLDFFRAHRATRGNTDF